MRYLISEEFVMVVNTFAVFAICAILFGMLCQHCYFISHNVTQIEMMKYDREEDRREEEGIDDEVVNFYDEGFYENWKSFLFPPKIQKKV
jgi:hypothetical protein